MDGKRPPITAVLGLGNVLMGDDALGPQVIEHLRVSHDFPDEVSLEDLGTPGLDLHPHVAGPEALIIVDTVRAAGEAGELKLYGGEDILAIPPGPRVSPHDPGLKEALLSLEFSTESLPSILLVGVIPQTVRGEVGLSPAVQKAVPTAVAAVVAELIRLGHDVRERQNKDDPDLWWEKQVDAQRVEPR